MNLNVDTFELGKRRIGDGIECLAGGVRHQMDMEFLLHKLFPIAPRIVVMPASAPCGQSQNGDACAQTPQTKVEPLGKVAPARFTNLLSPLSPSTRRSGYQPKPPQPTGLTSSSSATIKSLVMKVAL